MRQFARPCPGRRAPRGRRGFTALSSAGHTLTARTGRNRAGMRGGMTTQVPNSSAAPVDVDLTVTDDQAAAPAEIQISVVLPVHNEEECLEAELTRIRVGLDASPYTWELIAVDDGSSDRSPEILDAHPWVRRITLPTNRGSGTARRSGYRSRARHVRRMDRCRHDVSERGDRRTRRRARHRGSDRRRPHHRGRHAQGAAHTGEVVRASPRATPH